MNDNTRETDLQKMRQMVEREAYVNNQPVTEVVGNDWMTDNQPAATKTYSGPGMVIEPKAAPVAEPVEENENKIPYSDAPALARSMVDDINKYIDDLDNRIEVAQAEKAQHDAEVAAEESNNDYFDEVTSSQKADETSNDFNKRYNEAVVIIDKTNVGRVVDFTEEERAKLTHAKSIKLKEVELVDISTRKTKKAKKSDFYKFIQKTNKAYTTSVILPVSGYAAELKGLTVYETMALMQNTENEVITAQQKWSLIHSKIVSTSIGDMDFNEFLRHTSPMDYSNFVYGLLCATYPDDSDIPLSCPNKGCGLEYKHMYTNASLIRVEEFSDRLNETFAKIADASVSEGAAKEVHDNSPINMVKQVKLPSSGIIVEIYVQSVYDLINVSMKSAVKNKDNKYIEASILATAVRAAYFEDPDDGELCEVDNPLAICEMIYNLDGTDLVVIRKFSEEMVEGLEITYGFMNAKCPKCGTYLPSVPIDPEVLLFFRCRQALNTEID